MIYRTPLSHTVNHEIISGLILSNYKNSLAATSVYLHGAGLATKDNSSIIAPAILESQQNLLTFDFSGHGASTGQLQTGSLQRRVIEAQTMMTCYAAKQSLILCGASMGGYIAIKLLASFEVDTLILLCPALYNVKALNVGFNAGFTEIIRSPNSWRHTDAIEILEKYKGKLLIIMGENDEVIPPGVIDLILHHTPKAVQKELYIIPNCPHRISQWIADFDHELIKLQAKISSFLKN